MPVSGRRLFAVLMLFVAGAVSALAWMMIIPPGAFAQVAHGAGKGMKIARFHATVSGTLSVDWKQDTTYYDGCVDGYHRKTGAGTERIAFKSTRRARLDVLEIDGEPLMSPGLRGLPVRGTVSRHGSLHHEQLSGGESYCGGVPEDAEPEQPPALDCGKRSWTGGVAPAVLSPADYPAADGVVPLVPVVELQGPEVSGPGAAESLDDLYQNCVGGGSGLGPTSNSAFPHRRVFSKARRLVIRGSDTSTETTDGYTATATTRWRMVLVRRGRTVPTPDKSAKRRRKAPQCSNGRDDDGDGRTDFPRDRQCSSPRDRSER
jgi:hypothetical protein